MSPRLVCLALLLAALGAPFARAHEVRPAYLELRETSPETFDVLWKAPARGQLRLGVSVEFPPGVERLVDPVGVFVDDAYIERSRVRIPANLAAPEIRIAGLESTKIDALARIERLSGATQVERLQPGAPSFKLTRQPSFSSVAGAYTIIGVEHILLGPDHLLFVLALLLLVRGARRLIATITMFTVAHSVTLALATLGVVTVPGPPVEAFIALSIVFVASEVAHSRSGRAGLTERSPWIVAFSFGLLHGLGFAGALSDVGLPAHAIPAALLFFNVGVEVGQLLFVALILLAMKGASFLLTPNFSPRIAAATTYAIGAVASYWFIERVVSFSPLLSPWSAS